jgi:hypothetical protein
VLDRAAQTGILVPEEALTVRIEQKDYAVAGPVTARLMRAYGNEAAVAVAQG